MNDGQSAADEKSDDRAHFTALLNDLQGQLDRRIETQLRERAESIGALESEMIAVDRRLSEQIKTLREMVQKPSFNGVPLRDYIEALFEEGKRQRDTADQEREKAAEALRSQQYRALEQAEREREKAAVAMRENLDRGIKEGDERLREHIANQIAQIQSALDSAEKLEVQRMESAEDKTGALRREMQQVTQAQKEAVTKAEDAQKEFNTRTNEFRGQLSDQAAGLMPRREAELSAAEREKGSLARHGDLDRRIQLLERGESGRSGKELGSDRIVGFIVGGLGLLIAIVVAANAIAGS